MYEHLKMVKGIGPFDLLAKQLQRERHFQDATLSTSKFGRKVAMAVADEHQQISEVAIHRKAMLLPGSFIADMMNPMP